MKRFLFGLLISCLGIIGSTGSLRAQTYDLVRALAWSPAGSTLAIGGTIEGKTGVYLRQNSTITAFFETTGNVLRLAWSPDGTKLAGIVGGESGTIQIWDVNRGAILSTIDQGSAGSTYDLKWNFDGTYLAFAQGTTVVAAGKEITKLTVPLDKQFQTFAWYPNKNQIFVPGLDRILRLGDITTNKIILEKNTSSFVASLAASPDGKTLAIGGSDGTVQIWDLATYSILYTMQATKDVVWNLEWSGDGQTIAAAGSSYDITIWDANTGELLDIIEKRTAGFLTTLALSPYGGRLAYSTDSMKGTHANEISSLTAAQKDYTEPILNGAVQIVVPAPSLEKLQSIAQACGVQTSIQQLITAEQLQTFVTQVSALTDTQIPAGCKADLLAVTNALIAKPLD